MHFHDLRHTGNTWAAEAGATLRELMDRMGHASTRAALIYMHARDDRHKAVAQALSDLVARNLDEVGSRVTEDEPEDQTGT